MNNLDRARNQITHLLPYIMNNEMEQSFYKLISYSRMIHDEEFLNHHVNQIVFELIKDTYIEESKNKEYTTSLYKCSSGFGCEADLKRNSRMMQYAMYYRNELSKELEQMFHKKIPELSVIDMKNSYNRVSGYKVSIYDFHTLCAMEDLELLKYLDSKRIVDVKKVSNDKLNHAYQEYRKYFRNIYDHIQDDEEYVMFSILLFTTELKYKIETVYRLATKLSEYNNCKSKKQFGTSCIDEMLAFVLTIFRENGNGRFIKENSFILKKMEDIKLLNPENIGLLSTNYRRDLLFQMLAKRTVINYTEAKELIRSASYSEKRKFIEENYNIWSILDEEIVWKNKKGKYLRDIYKNVIKDIEPPKIK